MAYWNECNQNRTKLLIFGDSSLRCDICEILVECAKRFEPPENLAQCIRWYPVGAGPCACPDNMQPQGVAPTLFENELHHIIGNHYQDGIVLFWLHSTEIGSKCKYFCINSEDICLGDIRYSFWGYQRKAVQPVDSISEQLLRFCLIVELP